MGHAFMQLHHAIHWWGPGVMAVCVFLLPWIAYWPLRNHYDYETQMSGYVWMAVWALVIFYALWLALPHPGTEALLMIIAAPFVAIGVYIPGFAYLISLWELYTDWIHDRNKALGKPYRKNHKDFEGEREARMQGVQVNAAIIPAQQTGEDPRKEKFDVIDGGNTTQESHIVKRY